MIEKLLRRFISHDDQGWEEVGEKFTRYNVWKTRWFNIYIHQMWSPIAPPVCHDHPWSFVSLILRGGYWESTDGQTFIFRKPGRILYRPAEWAHTVKTVDRYAWSIVVTGSYKRNWENHDCRTGAIV